MSILQILVRYWFVLPVLLIVLAVQFGFGFVGAKNVSAPVTLPPTRVVTSMALTVDTSTPSPTASPTGTYTPSPTPTTKPSPTNTRMPTITPKHTSTPTSTYTPTSQPTPTGIPGDTFRVPILMYHYLSDFPPGADAIRQDLSVSPVQFEGHLAYLKQNGFETISMEQLSYALSQGLELPPKPVIITFDDGHRDNYVNAFPLLKKYGYTATFFVFTQVIDTYNVEYLTWEMVTEMHQAGMEFGSHGYRHMDLSKRDTDFLVYEILGSKEAIEERIQEPVRFFSYPAGRYDELTIRVLDSANFWGAVTTQWGAEHNYFDRFEMSRIRVRGNDMVEDLAEKLSLIE